jgi:hypothetical protein
VISEVFILDRTPVTAATVKSGVPFSVVKLRSAVHFAVITVRSAVPFAKEREVDKRREVCQWV